MWATALVMNNTNLAVLKAIPESQYQTVILTSASLIY